MPWVNMGVVGILLLSSAWGFLRGMLREFFSLAGWIGGAYVAWRWGRQGLAPHLAPYVPSAWRVPVADFLLFFVVLGLSALCAFLLRGILYTVGFGGPDRVVGALFGLLRGVIILAVLVFLAQATHLDQSSWWQRSWLGQPRVLALSQSITAPAVSYWELQTRGKAVSNPKLDR